MRFNPMSRIIDSQNSNRAAIAVDIDDLEADFGSREFLGVSFGSCLIDLPQFTVLDSRARRPRSDEDPVDEDYVEVLAFEEPPVPAA